MREYMLLAAGVLIGLVTLLIGLEIGAFSAVALGGLLIIVYGTMAVVTLITRRQRRA